MTAEGPEPPGASVGTPAPEETEERLAGPAERSGPDPADHIADGMGYLDQAIAAFSRACESGDDGVMPLAIELLARTLPLRGRDNDAALVWQRGLDDPDPAVSDVQPRDHHARLDIVHLFRQLLAAFVAAKGELDPAAGPPHEARDNDQQQEHEQEAQQDTRAD